ncbi:MAG TPA: hypothetical protein VFD70_29150 [Anaerolineae bacterium]|nr:hypothetical protein [Anaerolineae bacterium]
MITNKAMHMKQLDDLVAGIDRSIGLIREQILSLDPFGVDIRYPG